MGAIMVLDRAGGAPAHRDAGSLADRRGAGAGEADRGAGPRGRDGRADPLPPAGAAEQKVVALGVLGQATLAENDFAVYDYHGLAALRRALGGGRAPTTVVATTIGLGGASARVGTVTMTDGAVLRHRFADDADPDRASARWPSRLGLLGNAGSFVGDELRTHEPGGAPATARVERHVVDGSLHGVSVRGPDGDIRWRNPFAGLPFDDEEIGVATVLTGMADAVRTSEDPPYLASESLLDMEILTAMRYSAASRGRPVSLPVDILDQVRSRLHR